MISELPDLCHAAICTAREEVLSAYVFESLEQVHALTDKWLQTYNEERPHDSLGRVPSLTFMPRPNRPVASGYRVSA
jgi:putative transposase